MMETKNLQKIGTYSVFVGALALVLAIIRFLSGRRTDPSSASSQYGEWEDSMGI